MEARIASFGCVVLGSTLCGYRIAGISRRRERLLSDLLDAVQRLKTHMFRMLEPVSDAMVHADNALLGEIGRRMANGLSAKEAWRQVQDAANARRLGISLLNAQDRQTLDQFFDRLGESGREAQELHLSAMMAALERQRQDAEKQRRQSSALCTRLGFWVGLMLGLIFL